LTHTPKIKPTPTFTDIHPLIDIARVLAPTHMAKDYVEEVRRIVVIIVTLGVIIHTSMGNITINTSTIFSVTAATRSSILKAEKRGDITSLSCTVGRQLEELGLVSRPLKLGHRPFSTALIRAPGPSPRVAAGH